MKFFAPFVILLAFLLLNPVPATRLHGREARPNVVLIVADDIGISGISCYGSDSFHTPHIDRLAADGLQFSYGFSTPYQQIPVLPNSSQEAKEAYGKLMAALRRLDP